MTSDPEFIASRNATNNFRLYIDRSAARGEKASAVRKRVKEYCEITSVQLSRFEHSARPIKAKNGQYLHKSIENYLASVGFSAKDTFWRADQSEDVAQEIHERIEKILDRDIQNNKKHIYEILRSMTHLGYSILLGTRKSRYVNKSDVEGDYLVFYRTRDRDTFNVSMMTIVKSPYDNVYVFQEISSVDKKARKHDKRRGFVHILFDEAVVVYYFVSRLAQRRMVYEDLEGEGALARNLRFKTVMRDSLESRFFNGISLSFEMGSGVVQTKIYCLRVKEQQRRDTIKYVGKKDFKLLLELSRQYAPTIVARLRRERGRQEVSPTPRRS